MVVVFSLTGGLTGWRWASLEAPPSSARNCLKPSSARMPCGGWPRRRRFPGRALEPCWSRSSSASWPGWRSPAGSTPWAHSPASGTLGRGGIGMSRHPPPRDSTLARRLAALNDARSWRGFASTTRPGRGLRRPGTRHLPPVAERRPHGGGLLWGHGQRQILAVQRRGRHRRRRCGRPPAHHQPTARRNVGAPGRTPLLDWLEVRDRRHGGTMRGVCGRRQRAGAFGPAGLRFHQSANRRIVQQMAGSGCPDLGAGPAKICGRRDASRFHPALFPRMVP